MPEFRIEFSIQRAESEGDDFTEVGFGSSGSWDDVDSAVHAVSASVQNRQWETEPGQPEPGKVDQ